MTRPPNSPPSSTGSTLGPMEERLRHPKGLGETMVIAHAVVAAESGKTITMLIDDGQGAQTATSKINRLERLKANGHAAGSIKLANTLTGPERAVAAKHIPDKSTMQSIYERLRDLDDGLPPNGQPTSWRLPSGDRACIQ